MTSAANGAKALAATAGVIGALGFTGAAVTTASPEPLPRAGVTARVSVSSAGVEANGPSDSPAASRHGRYVVFGSDASNLVAEDTNVARDVFVRDLVAGTTERVSVATNSQQANNDSFGPAISATGRYVAFTSSASNLVTNDINDQTDLFVRDLTAGTTKRVSVATNSQQANNDSFGPAISADGRSVAFRSSASNLVARDTNNQADVFLRDLAAGTTRRVSIGPGGRQGNSDSGQDGVAISADGQHVAFDSDATNLVPQDTNHEDDTFVRDLTAGKIRRVSIAFDERQSNGESFNPTISAHGRFIAFSASATNLVVADTNGWTDVFVRDRVDKTTRRVSIGPNGRQARGYNYYPAISANGRYVVFHSSAGNLVTGDTNRTGDVFVRDQVDKTTRRVSVGPDGRQGNFSSGFRGVALSADGRRVAFASAASNLVAADSSRRSDVFVRTRALP